MADKKKDGSEPQSYGSNKDWLTGKTGETVDETPAKSSRTDEEFYESRHNSGSAHESPGSKRSPVDAAQEQNPSPDSPPTNEQDIPRKPA